MYSVAGAWESYRKSGRQPRRFPKKAGLTWLDCGGFTMLNRYEDCPFDLAWHTHMIARLAPNFFASRDYPCEPDISRKVLTTNEERIEETVKEAVAIAQYESMLWPSVLVPVIQRYTLEEYQCGLRLRLGN
ncbi:MAG: hypothetical protein GY803_22320 [Chloroflexi bacterium]|nr:hypothetical protein [Chloroflexota bacterium]